MTCPIGCMQKHAKFNTVKWKQRELQYDYLQKAHVNMQHFPNKICLRHFQIEKSCQHFSSEKCLHINVKIVILPICVCITSEPGEAYIWKQTLHTKNVQSSACTSNHKTFLKREHNTCSREKAILSALKHLLLATSNTKFHNHIVKFSHRYDLNVNVNMQECPKQIKTARSFYMKAAAGTFLQKILSV